MAHLAQSLFLSLSATFGLLRPLASLQTTVAETPTGSVVGYVYCADTNALHASPTSFLSRNPSFVRPE
jgi:hypothetical protein